MGELKYVTAFEVSVTPPGEPVLSKTISVYHAADYDVLAGRLVDMESDRDRYRVELGKADKKLVEMEKERDALLRQAVQMQEEINSISEYYQPELRRLRDRLGQLGEG